MTMLVPNWGSGGNPTSYAYDTLDRQTTMTFQDTSTRQYVYNQASDATGYTDENGSTFTNTFDALGRKTLCAITPASGVAGHNGDGTRGTVEQAFEYDGAGRLTKATDTTKVDNASAETAEVELFYDSLSRILEDAQTFDSNTREATNTEFASYPVTEFTYPDGRTIENTFDLLYRRTLCHDPAGGGTDIAGWEYYGPNRIAECVLGNGLIRTHLNNARTRSAIQDGEVTPGWGDQSSDRLGFDGAGRMITKRYLAGGIDGETHDYNNTSSLVGQTTAYDKSSNKLFERALQAESRSSLYEPRDTNGTATGGYDSLDRLRQYQRGVLSDGTGGGDPAPAGGSVVTEISLPNTDKSRNYELDGLGNWRRTSFDPVGSNQLTQIRQHNGLNAITSTAIETTKEIFSYDLNGNLLDDSIRKYAWDALNRLKQIIKTPSSPVLIGTYTYDALGRRIRKAITNDGLSGNIANGTFDYLYHGGNPQCIEERDGSNDPQKQYVWGHYIDELLQQTVDISGTPADEYPLQDLLYRTLALTDDAGDIIEAYDYEAYGNTLIFTAAGTGPDWWANDATQGNSPSCAFLFTGRRYDAESEVYFYRARYYMPELGRFISRDPIGYIDGMNPYAGYFVPNDRDPFGTACDRKLSKQDISLIEAILENLPSAGDIANAVDTDAKGAKERLQTLEDDVNPNYSSS